MTKRRKQQPRRRPTVPANLPKVPALPALPAVPADPAHAVLTGPAVGNRALMEAPTGPASLSMAQATAHLVDAKNYRAAEHKAANMALDFNGQAGNALSFVEATSFPGFPTLALLAQLPEYRTMHETLADECVRMWGKVKAAGDASPDTLSAIEAEFKRIDLRSRVRQAVIHDQAFGGAHVFFSMKDDKTARDTQLVLRPFSVPKGSFVGLRVVEPYWVTPNFYNSIDPTAADFYIPSTWWLLGIEVHATRMQTIISRPVPDMLKPTYSFRGISMSQLAIPYVDNWLRTRQSISDTVKQFSVSGVAMDLAQALQPGANVALQQRAQLINAYRDNRNLMLLDNATEEFFQVNTPLSGLDALQAQSQEQMSAVSHIPLVKLLGITPTGLNASSEGEIRVFYDYVRGYQSDALQPLMQKVLKVVQLSLFGAIDDGITWEWEPLMELTKLEDAERRNKDANTAQLYVDMGALNAQQVAAHLAADPTSGYSGLFDGTEAIEPADDDIEGITQQILQIGNEGAPNEPTGTGQEGKETPADHPEPRDGVDLQRGT
jgi:phage-related protein (TIGR01555 family)